MAKKSLAERAAIKWIKRKRKQYTKENFGWIAGAIIEGAIVTDKLPAGAKEIIRKRLAKEYGRELPEEFDEDENVLPIIRKPSEEAINR